MKIAGQRKLFEFLSQIILSPVYLLVKLIPKDKRLYLIGSSLGLYFADNSKYLFLYASQNVDNIKTVFISKNKKVVDFLKSNGYRAEYLYSWRGFKTVVRAKKAFLNHSLRDISPLLLGGAEIIQLWHGTPLKRIGYDADWTAASAKARIKNGVRKIIYSIFPYMYGSRWFDKIVVSSETISGTFQTAFGIDKTKIEIVGQPRNDCLHQEFRLDKLIFTELDFLKDLKGKYDIIISWLPTHRGKSGKTLINLIDQYGFDEAEFADFLIINNIGFIAKPHFLERETLADKSGLGGNFIIYDYVDPYPLLRYTNVLMTDYSSVFFDFLLTDRPMIFSPFDFDDYIKAEADYYYDYNEVTPGPKCRDWTETKTAIEDAIKTIKSGVPDSFAEKRLEICGRFNYYKTDFCQKIVEKFFDLSS